MITHAASRKHYYTVLLDRSLGGSFFVYSSPAGLERFECLRSTPVVATISNACKT